MPKPTPKPVQDFEEIDGAAVEMLRRIVSFFKETCPNDKEHYCPDCMKKFVALLSEAAELIEEV